MHRSATVRSFRLQNADALDAVQTTWLQLAEYGQQFRIRNGWAGGWLPLHAASACAFCASTLWNLVSELSPRQQTVLRALFTERPRPYAEVARLTGIPMGGIGPPGREPWRSFGSGSRNTGSERRLGADDALTSTDPCYQSRK